MFQVSVQKFGGPIEKLLELIEEKQLDVSEISLAKVTNDFLMYMETSGNVPPAFLADFVSVASRLILIKSRSLLPDIALTEEEQAEIKELEWRVLFYKSWRPAEKGIAGLFSSQNKLWSRPYFLNSSAVFYPSNNLSTISLCGALDNLIRSFEKYTREKQEVKATIIAIEEKISEVLSRLTSESRISFHAVKADKHIAEIIALFLAVLHLAREGRVHVEQNKNFSDIIVSGLKTKE